MLPQFKINLKKFEFECTQKQFTPSDSPQNSIHLAVSHIYLENQFHIDLTCLAPHALKFVSLGKCI